MGAPQLSLVVASLKRRSRGDLVNLSLLLGDHRFIAALLRLSILQSYGRSYYLLLPLLACGLIIG